MLIPSASAQTVDGAGQPGFAAGLLQFLPFVLVLAAFYFIMWLPQQRRQKQFRATIEALKKGDQVITAGGVAGRVTRVDERFAEVEIAPNVRIRVVKSTIAEVTGPGGKPAND